jgi:hypothetical protein
MHRSNLNMYAPSTSDSTPGARGMIGGGDPAICTVLARVSNFRQIILVTELPSCAQTLDGVVLKHSTQAAAPRKAPDHSRWLQQAIL